MNSFIVGVVFFLGFCFGYWVRTRQENVFKLRMERALIDLRNTMTPVVMIGHKEDCPVNAPGNGHCNCDFSQRLANYLNVSEGKPQTGTYQGTPEEWEE